MNELDSLFKRYIEDMMFVQEYDYPYYHTKNYPKDFTVWFSKYNGPQFTFFRLEDINDKIYTQIFREFTK